jgi:hypothetical protein
LNGAASPANCARNIAGPFMVFGMESSLSVKGRKADIFVGRKGREEDFLDRPIVCE